jgi:hypothetical protein
MNKAGLPRTLVGRGIELVALGAVLAAFYVAGTWLLPRMSRPAAVAAPVRPPDTHPYDALNGIPPLRVPRFDDARQTEPRALEARAAVIHHDLAAIRAECQRAADGDWDKWLQDTEPYRMDLGAKLAAIKQLPPGPAGPRYGVLEGFNGFPLFEVDARLRIDYLRKSESVDEFRRTRAVVAADRWLRQRGIDLIFVSVPKMTEIYIEHFLNPCPADGIIAPHVRRALLELLQQDVEVVDGFRLFRTLRGVDKEYLYNTADTHWAPRGMRIMAKAIADRIERYEFGARARYALPIYRTAIGPYQFKDFTGAIGHYGRALLSPEQVALAKPAQTTSLIEVESNVGMPLADSPSSPVLVIGHSYVFKFREQLIRELNQLINTRWGDDQTTQQFADFLRDPSLLAHCRVVVWVTNEQHLPRFAKMPSQIMQTLETSEKH